MVLKLIFLIILCIPIACLQIYLLIEAAKDLKKPKKSIRTQEQPISSRNRVKKNHLRIAK